MENLEKTCLYCKHWEASLDCYPCNECNSKDDLPHWCSEKQVSPPSPTQAIKHDTGKPRYSLMPPEALDGLANLYTLGCKKYADRNWEKGMEYSRVFDAMNRHAWKWFRGEKYDTEDKQHHLLSVMWCAMALYTYEIRGTGTDDRPEGCADGESMKNFWKIEEESSELIPL